MTWEIIEGDCLDVMRGMADASVDLIVTSPPYAKRRQSTYGGIDADHYCDWFLPISAELYRVLSPSGSFVLNIKEHCENGERHTYVLDLIHALRGQGWLWTEEYIWHKTNPVPGRWPNRFKDGWERCLHFTRTRQFAMHQESVMLDSDYFSRTQKSWGRQAERVESSTSSGFGVRKETSAWRERVYPSNVLSLPGECRNQHHPAPFPVALPDWFIRLFTQQGDTVLDPFAGSGTTGVACINTGRDFIGVELNPDYCTIARRRLTEAAASQQPALFAAD